LRSCAASGGTANLDLATGIVAHADKVIELLAPNVLSSQ
jgi:hypothetical protein